MNIYQTFGENFSANLKLGPYKGPGEINGIRTPRICLCNSGPSLAKYIEPLIVDSKNSGIICGVTNLPFLLNSGIIPDIVICQDSSPIVADILTSVESFKDKLEYTVFAKSLFCNPAVMLNKLGMTVAYLPIRPDWAEAGVGDFLEQIVSNLFSAKAGVPMPLAFGSTGNMLFEYLAFMPKGFTDKGSVKLYGFDFGLPQGSGVTRLPFYDKSLDNAYSDEMPFDIETDWGRTNKVQQAYETNLKVRIKTILEAFPSLKIEEISDSPRLLPIDK